MSINIINNQKKEGFSMKSVTRKFAMIGLFLGLTQVTSSAVALGKEGPGFEIWNFDTIPAWFEVTVGNRNEMIRIHPNSNASMEIDLNAPITIKIYLSQSEKDNELPTVTWTTRPSAAGKTKYFSFDRKKHKVSNRWIYPQTGTLGGLLGRSKSGFSLSKNIKESDYGV